MSCREQVKKSFYLEQAKVLKDHFHERFPSEHTALLISSKLT